MFRQLIEFLEFGAVFLAMMAILLLGLYAPIFLIDWVWRLLG